VAARGDEALSRGVRDLIAKLTVAVPRELQPVIVDSGLVPVSYRERLKDNFDVALVRRAIRGQTKMAIDYADKTGNVTRRVIWPFLLAYWDQVRLIGAWCELRQDFRHFRTDRVRRAETLGRFPERITTLRRK
jgi:predicted DNA-binding transcriptional regulator YafY